MVKCSNPRCVDTRVTSTERCSNCRSLFAGKVLRNRYKVDRMIGKGGFGITYLVEDRDCFGEYRVLKELFPHVTDNIEDAEEDPAVTAERLFQREAKVLLSLQHPGIPKLYAYFTDSGYSYLVQDWIPGQTLYDELKSRKRTFGEQDVCTILVEIADILEYLHGHNPPIIHRDIKPQNLMRHDNGKIQLIDFGAVYQSTNIKSNIQTLIGSPGYAPPEQIIGSPVPQSDLYAAGATILYLLTGIHPSKMFNHTTKHMEWESHAQVSWELAELLTEMLLVDLSKRLKSATELKRRLQKIVTQYSKRSNAFVSEFINTKVLSEQNNTANPNKPEDIAEKAKSPAVQQQNTLPSATSKNYVPPVETWTSPISENSGAMESQFDSTGDGPPDEGGNFYDMPFPFLLRRIYRERLSGRLTCLNANVTKTLYFDQGAIVYAKSNLLEDGFGETMVRIGRIDQKTFSQVSQLVKEKNLRFGAALIKGGWISPEQLKDLISEQFCSITYSLFTWENGRYEIYREVARKSSIKVSLSTADIIFEGLRKIQSIDLVKKWLGDFRWKLCVTKDPFLLYQSISLNPKEAFIVSRIENARSIEEILSMGGLPEDETIRTLCGLVAVGLLEWVKEEQPVQQDEEAMSISQIIVNHKPKTPAFDMQSAANFCYEVEKINTTLDSMNHYALLGISRSATEEEVRQAYAEQSQKFHPDNNAQLAKYNISLRNDLEKIFTRISEAYRVLINLTTRQNYDRSFRTTSSNAKVSIPSDVRHDKVYQPARVENRASNNANNFASSRVDSYPKNNFFNRTSEPYQNRTTSPQQNQAAQSMFEKGIKYFQSYEYKQAYYAFQAAVDVAPQHAEYRIFLARTLLHLNEQAKAKEQFSKAIELEPKNPDYYVEFGLLYQRMNMPKQAYLMFDKALEIMPGHLLAKRAKEALRP